MKQKKISRWIAAMLVMCMIFSSGALEALAAEASAGKNVIQCEDDPGAGRYRGNIAPEFYGGKAVRATKFTHDSRFDDYIIKKGIDVSAHQAVIDWKKVKKAGINFAIIRVAYRGWGTGKLLTDPMAQANIQGAIDAGIPVGVYVFSQAISENEAIEEADIVLKQIQGYNIELPVVMDVEFASDDPEGGRLYKAKLSKEKQTAVCKAFSKKVQDNGYTPMIYANKSMLENNMNAAEVSAFSKIWLARYNSYAGYAGDYEFWQYRSDGAVDGITGNVDMNFWYVEDESLFQVSDFKVAGTTTSSVNLQWKENEAADGYEIYRKKENEEYSLVADIADASVTAYKDSALSGGTSYAYKVRAYTNSETGKVYSEFTNPQSAITRPKGTKLQGRAYGLGKIKFTWEKVPGVSGYQIRKVTSSGTSAVATISGSESSSYVLSGLNCDTSYKYLIRTYKEVNGTKIYSYYSPTITVKTSGSAIGVVKENKINIRTKATTSSTALKKVNKGTKLTVTGISGDWYRISTTVDGKQRTAYIYKKYVSLVSVGKPELSGYGRSFSSTKLTWSRVSGAEGYVLQRYNSSLGKYETVKTITRGSTVSYTNYYLNASTTYKYRVRAYKIVYGTKVYGSYSDVKSIKTKAPRKGKVTGSIINVRKGAGTKYSVLKKVKKGTVLTVTGSRKGWYRISITVNGRKRTGYIIKDYVRLY